MAITGQTTAWIQLGQSKKEMLAIMIGAMMWPTTIMVSHAGASSAR